MKTALTKIPPTPENNNEAAFEAQLRKEMLELEGIKTDDTGAVLADGDGKGGSPPVKKRKREDEEKEM